MVDVPMAGWRQFVILKEMRNKPVESFALAAALTVLAIFQCSSSSAAPEQGKPGAKSAPRIALVIGNANYVRLGRLSNPGNDAHLIAQKLGQLGFEVTEAADLDLKQMSDDVDAFAGKIRERGPQTVSVLYYAGHGIESDSINYLVPVNADIRRRSEVSGKSLSVKRVAERLSGAGNALNILILDACRDNPFAETAPGIVGLVPMGAVYGVFIASSTGSGKTAFDGDDGHSPYTRALAEAMMVPGEKLEDVFKSVRRQVRLATGEAQIPWESTSLESDFFFVPPRPAPSPAAQLFAAAQETGNIALYDLLIERFAGSPEAVAARPIAARLRQMKANEIAATPSSAAALVLARAKQAQTADAYDLVASLFPDTAEAEEARAPPRYGFARPSCSTVPDRLMRTVNWWRGSRNSYCGSTA
jgi:uncharacterized caspase-like protein